MQQNWYIHPAVEEALRRDCPMVALESAFLTHGLPPPVNLATAQAMLSAVRQTGAVPAMLAIVRGAVHVGVSEELLQELAQSKTVRKCSTRDLAGCIIRGETAGLTVAASLLVAKRAGIRVLATGGIGGVHRAVPGQFDVSADLFELARRPVAVVCSGTKSLMDIAATLEALETLGVPVWSWGRPNWPAFLVADSGLPSPAWCTEPRELARIIGQHWALGGAGVLVAVPPPHALSPDEHENALRQALQDAQAAGVRGPDLTPFVLQRLAELTQGRSLFANQDLLVHNARHAALLAGELALLESHHRPGNNPLPD